MAMVGFSCVQNEVGSESACLSEKAEASREGAEGRRQRRGCRVTYANLLGHKVMRLLAAGEHCCCAAAALFQASMLDARNPAAWSLYRNEAFSVWDPQTLRCAGNVRSSPAVYVCAREVLRAIHGCGSDDDHDSRGASVDSYCTSGCFLAAKIARSRTPHSNKVSPLLGLISSHLLRTSTS